MNKHIELVKKWLDDPTSVTQQELEDNRNAADAANAARDAYTYAAYYAHVDDAVEAEYWVKIYEELKEQGE
jgi:acyl dehydratase